MKNLLIASLILLTATPAFAGTKTVYYPQEACAEILSQEYSTGGGDTVFQILEILCKDAEGNYTGFAVSWGSAAGFLGMGRVGMVDKFIYTPYDGDTLTIN